MKKIAWTKWAAIAEVIGTLGIFVSLIFIAININKGTDESIAPQITKLYETARQNELAVTDDPGWVTAAAWQRVKWNFTEELKETVEAVMLEKS